MMTGFYHKIQFRKTADSEDGQTLKHTGNTGTDFWVFADNFYYSPFENLLQPS
jgi:hypothetical protein